MKILIFPNSILPVTETGEIVFISTEFLCFCLGFILTEALVDDRPDHIIVLHVVLYEGKLLFCLSPPLSDLKTVNVLLDYFISV